MYFKWLNLNNNLNFVKLGKLEIPNRLILAPMAEVTDAPFRKISKKFGAGLTFTQMVSAEGVVNQNFYTSRYLSFGRDEKPIGVQILGNETETLYKAVKEIKKFSPDVIDLNCGCPVPHVRANNLGSSVSENTKHLGELIAAMYRAAGDTAVSVKLRLGSCYSKINVVENAKAAEDNGASFVTVHFRNISDRYDTKPDFSFLEKIKKEVSIPIIANGSIFNPQDAIYLLKELGADGVMIARGALGNPFIFERINKILNGEKDPGHPDILTVTKVLKEHLNLLKREFGEFRALDRAKKLILWYSRFFNGISVLVTRILRARDFDELLEIIESHTISVLNDSFISDDIAEIQSKFEKKVLFWLLDSELIVQSKTA
ncbi:MAG: tRNA-dihydrouridine synthase [Ignavibacteria bacterium]|nr:MAG: tRNA-dihydrouridine synthase [Ignavibacteria bacterium]